MNGGGWKVRFRREFLSDQVIIAVMRDIGDTTQVLDRTGTVHTVGIAEAFPQEVEDELIRLPEEAWEALCEAAAGESHLGAENRVLREWLKVERERVDDRLRE